MGDGVRRQRHEGRATFVRVFEVHVDAPPASLPPRVNAGEFRIVGTARLDRRGRSAQSKAASRSPRASRSPGSRWPISQAIGAIAADALRRLRGGRPRGDRRRCRWTSWSRRRPRSAQIRGAGLTLERLTVHTLAEDRRVDLVTRARKLQASVGGFRVFAPLAESQSITTPSTGYDDVKQIALARVALQNIASIQVDWVQLRPKARAGGADDGGRRRRPGVGRRSGHFSARAAARSKRSATISARQALDAGRAKRPFRAASAG